MPSIQILSQRDLHAIRVASEAFRAISRECAQLGLEGSALLDLGRVSRWPDAVCALIDPLLEGPVLGVDSFAVRVLSS